MGNKRSITNGNEVVFRVAVKPTPSIKREQKTVSMETGKTESLVIQGRHDACIALRAPVIFEACAAIAAADFYLINKANN